MSVKAGRVSEAGAASNACRNGEVDPGYDEAEAVAYMKRAELEVRVDVGIGTGRSTVWTCDLTAGYIAINADYRT